MDTNTIALLIELMRDKTPDNSSWGPIIVTIVGMLIAAIPPTIAALKASSNSKRAADTAESFKDTAIKTAESVEKVHVAVNSERTAMIQEMKTLRDEVLGLSRDKSKLEEHQRGKELSEARQAGQASEVAKAQHLAPNPAPIEVEVVNAPGTPVPVKAVPK